MGTIKYVQLAAGDFLADPDFQLMSSSERGIYCSIIFYMYLNDGKILNNPERIKKLCNISEAIETFEENWKTVQKKFAVKNGHLTHKRVRKELAKAKKFICGQKQWAKKSSSGGKRSADLRNARTKGTHTDIQWAALLKETKGKCPRCDQKTAHFDKDHVMPIYQGGSDSIDNIQPLCAKCNSQKGPESIDFFGVHRTKALSLLELPLNHPANINKVKVSKVKESKDKDKEQFNISRQKYPGNKRGLEPEFKYFLQVCKTHRLNPKEILPLLEPAIEKQKLWRQSATESEFRAPWKDFKSWIYNRYWTLEVGGSQVSTVCHVCGKPTKTYQYDVKTGTVKEYVCDEHKR